MRAWSVLFLVMVSCSSDPAAPEPAADAGGDTAAADTESSDSAAGDSVTDSSVDGDGAVVATCLEVADGTGAAPTSGSAKVAWAKTYSTNGSARFATGTATATFVSGSTEEDPPKFGALDLTPKSSAGPTGYIAKLQADGAPAWVRSVAGASSGGPRANIAMIGSELAYAYAGVAPFSIGDKSATGTGSTIALGVLRDDGSTRSFATFPATDGKVIAMAGGAAGLVHVIVSFGQPVDIAGKTLDCDLVLMALDADAKAKWGRCVSTPKGSIYSIDGFGVDAAGNSYISGFPKTMEIDLGDGTKKVDNSFGASVLFKVDPAGKTLWSQIWLGAYARDLAIAADGTIYTFGDVPTPKNATIANELVHRCETGFEWAVTKLDTSGKRLWTKTFGTVSIGSIALATDGVWFSIQATGAGDMAKGLPAPKNVGVAKVSSAGAVTMMQTFPSAADPLASPFSGSVMSAAGDAVFVGQMTADFVAGGSTVTKKGGYSDVVVRIGP
jgi:hypothetical protein